MMKYILLMGTLVVISGCDSTLAGGFAPVDCIDSSQPKSNSNHQYPDCHKIVHSGPQAGGAPSAAASASPPSSPPTGGKPPGGDDDHKDKDKHGKKGDKDRDDKSREGDKGGDKEHGGRS